MRTASIGLVCGALGCKAMPPPPVVAFHGVTEALPKGSTTAMLVVGIATQVLGGGGIGVAVRVERQATELTRLGVELTGGKGDDDYGETHWLLAMRGYGQLQLPETRYVAATYGAGLSYMTAGLLTLTVHGGAAISAPNDVLSPFVGSGLAAAIPLRRGRSWGTPPHHRGCFPCFEPQERPVTNILHSRIDEGEPVEPELYVYGDAGIATTFGGTKNQLSIDAGFMTPLRADGGGMLSFSIADAQRWEPATDVARR